MTQIGANIRKLRKEKGISQEAVAIAISSTKSTVSKYELGHREPSWDVLRKIADALGVSYFDLLGKDELKFFEAGAKEGQEAEEFYNRQVDEAWAMEGYTYSDQECDLINAFSQLNDDNQKKVTNYAQDLAKVDEYRRPDAPPAPPEGTEPAPAAKPTEGPEEGG